MHPASEGAGMQNTSQITTVGAIWKMGSQPCSPIDNTHLQHCSHSLARRNAHKAPRTVLHAGVIMCGVPALVCRWPVSRTGSPCSSMAPATPRSMPPSCAPTGVSGIRNPRYLNNEYSRVYYYIITINYNHCQHHGCFRKRVS